MLNVFCTYCYREHQFRRSQNKLYEQARNRTRQLTTKKQVLLPTSYMRSGITVGLPTSYLTRVDFLHLSIVCDGGMGR